VDFKNVYENEEILDSENKVISMHSSIYWEIERHTMEGD
jgi:hypothetical protein